MRDKRELIEKFIDSITPDSDVDKQWIEYVNRKKREEFATLVKDERLKPSEAYKFIEDSFAKGYIAEGGTEIYAILPAINPFDKKANRQGIFQRVLDRLKGFFHKFYEVSNADFAEPAPDDCEPRD